MQQRGQTPVSKAMELRTAQAMNEANRGRRGQSGQAGPIGAGNVRMAFSPPVDDLQPGQVHLTVRAGLDVGQLQEDVIAKHRGHGLPQGIHNALKRLVAAVGHELHEQKQLHRQERNTLKFKF